MTIDLDFKQQLNRTLAIVRRLSEGERIKLPSGHTIGMGEDMTIGFMMEYPNGEWRISRLSTIDLKQLNDELNDCPFPYLPMTRATLEAQP